MPGSGACNRICHGRSADRLGGTSQLRDPWHDMACDNNSDARARLCQARPTRFARHDNEAAMPLSPSGCLRTVDPEHACCNSSWSTVCADGRQVVAMPLPSAAHVLHHALRRGTPDAPAPAPHRRQIQHLAPLLRVGRHAREARLAAGRLRRVVCDHRVRGSLQSKVWPGCPVGRPSPANWGAAGCEAAGRRLVAVVTVPGQLPAQLLDFRHYGADLRRMGSSLTWARRAAFSASPASSHAPAISFP
jgi:hypothetical protein